MAALGSQLQLLQTATKLHAERSRHELEEQRAVWQKTNTALIESFRKAAGDGSLGQAWSEYVRDSGERFVLMLDALRRRGDMFYAHEAAGSPPVLIYDYEVVMDARGLPRPCNYMLLRILPKAGVTVHEWKRPYVIIDPRAGHGPGIGGFKTDSQVGVALSDGHPVYFVAFRPMPEPDQTLACVTHAEAAFLREIMRRHPGAPQPIVVGNCQGGWATAILAATNPDLAGPIVLNGSPMSYWSGRLGQDPMRYNGGMLGGVLPALIMSDLGHGVFDGAHLVYNFEKLNPARTWFRKYFELYSEIDQDDGHFLDFERWWGGFYLMNEAEIRWIVENLFVGNKLAKGEARLETGRPIDLKAIRAPIIVFASHGDNITPPQQALNWIVDTYADESEIEIRGQRIIYMVHDQVGHLGIFVSSAVAKREHTQMASTLKTIEALAPGLYEMKIDDIAGEGHAKRFTVSFHQRKMTDILDLGTGREEEPAFAAVARMSEQLAELYDATARPIVQAMVTPQMAEMARAMHPVRLKRTVMATRNPAMAMLPAMADNVRASRTPAAEDNPFVALERAWADMVEQSIKAATDVRAAWYETAFLSIYASPWAHYYGHTHQTERTRKSKDELRALPVVIEALAAINKGGLPEAVVRMMLLLAGSRGNVRRDRLERSSELLTSRSPFAEMESAARTRMIHMQNLMVHFEHEASLQALATLLPDAAARKKAIEMVDYVAGSWEEMETRTREMSLAMRRVLDLPAPLKSIDKAAAE